MKIGVVSDTHDRIVASLYRALDGVDEILHCGDICGHQTLAALEAIAPVTAVHGNCDSIAFVNRFPVERRVQRGSIEIALVHGHRFRRGSVRHLADHFSDEPPTVVLFGHSHVSVSEKMNGVLFFNPGTAGGIGAAPSAGLLEITDDGFELRHVAL